MVFIRTSNQNFCDCQMFWNFLFVTLFRFISQMQDFIRTQGKRVKFHSRFRGSLQEIFSDLSISLRKANIGPSSAMAADIVTIGDSWLHFAIKKGVIEPIHGVEDQDWYKDLSEKWKVTQYFILLSVNCTWCCIRRLLINSIRTS